MQLISIDQLKQLLPGGQGLDESEDVAPGLSFKALCGKYQEALGLGHGTAETYRIFKDDTLSKYCPPIKFVGDGSSRAAFACIGGKCIKVAKNDAGVAQNRQEDRHTARRWWRPGYKCFAQTYDRGGGYGILLTECCAQMKSSADLAKALGAEDVTALRHGMYAMCTMKFDETAAVERLMGEYRRRSATAKAASEIAGKNASHFSTSDGLRGAAEWIMSVTRRKNPATDQIRDLMRFWRKYGVDQLLPADISNCENWGFAVRNGRLEPVILDAGFSREVASKFYG